MLYHIHCLDKADHLQVRLDNRDAHLQHLSSLGSRLFAAGPLLDEDEQMMGSVLVIEFDSRDDAEAFCSRDPYAQAGLFQKVEISAWKKVLPAQ